MWTETEDVHVIKLIYFVARIPKHLDLHFSDFSTNFYEFSNFAVLSSWRFCTWPPGLLASSPGRPLAAKQRKADGAISSA